MDPELVVTPVVGGRNVVFFTSVRRELAVAARAAWKKRNNFVLILAEIIAWFAIPANAGEPCTHCSARETQTTLPRCG